METPMRLYRSTNYPSRWYAHGRETGWVMFPAALGGWEKRQPARGAARARHRSDRRAGSSD
ncbi:hypothetical protein SBA6_410018 [Candidatus Sulfopaludibacter sp. SbA6]|nr:hypothetical protein SBA6_410018 [Candidatus Sulfopaludibacter sp. SbA6]